VVFTTSLQSSDMIVCSHWLTVASLTVDVAVHALPMQQRAMFPLIQSERLVRAAQLAAF